MEMTLIFHGTTKQCCDSIKTGGFSKSNQATWSCSDSQQVYFYEIERLKNSECLYDSDKNYIIDECIRRAFESAQVRAAQENYLKTELAVLCYEVPSELIEDDSSCENASCACQIPVDIINLYKPYKIYINDLYNPALRFFYLPFKNNFLNTYMFSSIEQRVFNMIEDIEASEIFEYILDSCSEWKLEED